MKKTPKILILTNKILNWETYIEQFKTQGFHVIQGTTEHGAIPLVKQENPDIILLDGASGQKNTKNFCKQLKSHPLLTDIYIILFYPSDIKWNTGTLEFKNSVDECHPFPITDKCFLAYINAGVNIKEARAQSKFTSLLVESATDGILVHDLNGHVVYGNPAICKILGYPQDEINTLTLEYLTIWKTSQASEGWISAIKKQGQHTFSCHLDGKEGNIIPVKITCKIATINGQDIIISDVRDVRMQKRVEEALQERTTQLTERFKELSCMYHVSNFCINTEMALDEIYLNTLDVLPRALQFPDIACARLLVSEREYATNNFQKTQWLIAANLTAQGEKIGSLEVCYLEEIASSPIDSFLPEEVNLIHTIAEQLSRITQQAKTEHELEMYREHLKDLVKERTQKLTFETENHKQTAKALAQSEKKFRTLFNSTSDSILIHNLEGQFLEVNNCACQRLGYSREELLKMSLQDIVSPKYAPKLPQQIKKLLENQQLLLPTEHLTKNHKTIPTQLHSYVLDYNDEKAILSIAWDVIRQHPGDKE